MFCDVKNGRAERELMHPSIDHLLDETQGIIVYQEQVMQIAQEMAGYSLGGADLLRRAMGKKIQEEMDKEKPKFLKGSAENGVDAKRPIRFGTCWTNLPITVSIIPRGGLCGGVLSDGLAKSEPSG